MILLKKIYIQVKLAKNLALPIAFFLLLIFAFLLSPAFAVELTEPFNRSTVPEKPAIKNSCSLVLSQYASGDVWQKGLVYSGRNVEVQELKPDKILRVEFHENLNPLRVEVIKSSSHYVEKRYRFDFNGQLASRTLQKEGFTHYEIFENNIRQFYELENPNGEIIGRLEQRDLENFKWDLVSYPMAQVDGSYLVFPVGGKRESSAEHFRFLKNGQIQAETGYIKRNSHIPPYFLLHGKYQILDPENPRIPLVEGQHDKGVKVGEWKFGFSRINLKKKRVIYDSLGRPIYIEEPGVYQSWLEYHRVPAQMRAKVITRYHGQNQFKLTYHDPYTDLILVKLTFSDDGVLIDEKISPIKNLKRFP